jgi:hypothetical protein
VAELSTDLVVRGEAVQALYARFRAGNLLVNRRYQRKLVWSVEEKQSFIDSLLRRLPVPLILVAERSTDDRAHLEIIDGLQRLDAVFSFLENGFKVDKFFDLDALAETKEERDAGRLRQSRPKLPRDICTRFAGYNLPLSIYRAHTDEEVDEIFRRINSGGRHLSRQDLRQAGSTSNFADLVREISAAVRGDVSMTDLVDLRDMPKISISSTDDDIGIFVDDIPWVNQGVLGREQVRESRDEEVIADLLGSMLVDPTPAYDSRVLDEFYGLNDDDDSRQGKVEAAIQKDSPELIQDRFMAALDAFLQIFASDQARFATVLFDEPRSRVPRYFESIFLGLDTLLHEEGLRLDDPEGARSALAGVGNKHLDIPGGGGTWTATSKKKNAEVAAGLLRKYMRRADSGHGPLSEKTTLEVENLLQAAVVESSLIEFKQGLCSLGKQPKLNGQVVVEICKTLSAMCNQGPEIEGFVVVGIADTASDASRVEAVGGPAAKLVREKYVVGVDLDAQVSGSLDELLQWLTSKIRDSKLDPRVSSQVLRDLRVVKVAERPVILIRASAQDEPVPFGDQFFERHGSQTVEIPVPQVGKLFTRFQN